MREQTGGSHREQSQDADTVREFVIDNHYDREGYKAVGYDAAYAALARLVAAAERTDQLERDLRDAQSITYSGLVTRTMQRAAAAEAERDAALARVELARRVTDAYTAEAEDHNDGEFALWKADDLINAIVALRAALGGPDA